MKKIISFLIPILLAIIVTVSINNYLDKQIIELTQEKNVSQIGAKYGDLTKDKSAIIKKIISDKGDLFLMGSSEMGVDTPQNAIQFFPFEGADYNVSCFGRAYTQDLQQATVLGGCDLKENQNIALIVSSQWFEDPEGMQAKNFAVNFSDIQFYNFLNNPKISEENKEYYAKRVYNFLVEAKKYSAEALYARLYYSKSPLKKYAMVVMNPYYKISGYLLNVKDKALIYKELKALPNKQSNTELKSVNWQDEYEKIQKENSELVSTNQFKLQDDCYNKNLKDVVDKIKGNSKGEDLINSKEMNDYKFLLSVCKELNIKPYIIMPPVNGWYNDYLGLDKGKRNEYYNKIKMLAEEQDIDVLDLSENDYKQYFLIDIMHLGKEGWLKVSEGIYKHFDQR
ncbi:MAG: D-alanyl-lipoteichoic acid biosynthesis protein DltD [Clostridium sp.]|uniref:D-alanyl-lipoteichoic acid biosynthesis protein DltD n=1 Tax=Clostridium sp. TaxID=1506 RepID=UPI0025C57E6E|nr:D-alanyl-lipoteichoic acid biosynthesis protein DltD [Clostridium sp.]MCE5220971.1 D-alanyl-lipoteichoic acid biosynthesis protein DltD [Clostridium sp.]